MSASILLISKCYLTYLFQLRIGINRRYLLHLTVANAQWNSIQYCGKKYECNFLLRILFLFLFLYQSSWTTSILLLSNVIPIPFVNCIQLHKSRVIYCKPISNAQWKSTEYINLISLVSIFTSCFNQQFMCYDSAHKYINLLNIRTTLWSRFSWIIL